MQASDEWGRNLQFRGGGGGLNEFRDIYKYVTGHLCKFHSQHSWYTLFKD